METKSALQTTLRLAAEAEMKDLLRRMLVLSVGDLKGVEQEVLSRTSYRICGMA